MKKLIIQILLVLSALTAVPVQAEDKPQEGDLPDCVAMLPEYTRAIVYAEGLKDIPAVKSAMTLLSLQLPSYVTEAYRVLTGRMVFSMLTFGKGDHVTVLLGVGVQNPESQWTVMKTAAETMLVRESIRLPEVPEGPVYSRKKVIAFISRSPGQDMVWLSNSEAAVQAAAAGRFNGGKTIKNNRQFTATLEASGGPGQAFGYIDLQAVIPAVLEEAFRPRFGSLDNWSWRTRAVNSLNLQAGTAVCVSIHSGLTVRAALQTREADYGLPALLFGRNSNSKLISRIPQKAGYAVRINPSSLQDILGMYKLTCGHVDPDISAEIDIELAELKQKTGIDLEQDLFRQIQDEILIIGNVHDGSVKFLETYNPTLIAGLDDRASMEKTLKKLFSCWEKQPEREVIGNSLLFTKGGIGFLVGDGIIGLGYPSMLREIAGKDLSSTDDYQKFQKELNEKPFSMAGFVNIPVYLEPFMSAISKKNHPDYRKVKPFIDMGLALLPKYVSACSWRNEDMITFELKQVD